MTVITRCRWELHDSLYFATEEIGRLYETEPIIHNYALTYALGFVQSPYFMLEQIPQYEEDLSPLNSAGIYVTPARVLAAEFVLSTWKYVSNWYHVEMEKTSSNTPGFGRVKEIAAGTQFECFVQTPEEPRLRRWIRLGKWMSKARLEEVESVQAPPAKHGIYSLQYPLNPLDVMFTNRLLRYDLISMPPVSLITHAELEGEYWQIEGACLPAKLAYRFSPETS